MAFWMRMNGVMEASGCVLLNLILVIGGAEMVISSP